MKPNKLRKNLIHDAHKNNVEDRPFQQVVRFLIVDDNLLLENGPQYYNECSRI